MGCSRGRGADNLPFWQEGLYQHAGCIPLNPNIWHCNLSELILWPQLGATLRIESTVSAWLPRYDPRVCKNLQVVSTSQSSIILAKIQYLWDFCSNQTRNKCQFTREIEEIKALGGEFWVAQFRCDRRMLRMRLGSLHLQLCDLLALTPVWLTKGGQWLGPPCHFLPTVCYNPVVSYHVSYWPEHLMSKNVSFVLM